MMENICPICEENKIKTAKYCGNCGFRFADSTRFPTLKAAPNSDELNQQPIPKRTSFLKNTIIPALFLSGIIFNQGPCDCSDYMQSCTDNCGETINNTCGDCWENFTSGCSDSCSNACSDACDNAC